VGIDVTWLGHSTVVMDVDGTGLLTDPLLHPHAGLLRRRTERPRSEVWRHADAILLSHLHHDHADLRSLKLLRGIPVITALENVGWLRRHRLAGVAPPPDGWLDVRPGGTRVTLTPAVHHSRPMPHRPNAATGHLVSTTAGVVWFAGDTSLFDDMSLIPDVAGAPIDLAIVPISGWGPRLSGGHMGPAEAAQACALVGARWALPVHWGTLHPPGLGRFPHGWMDRPATEFASAVDRYAPGCEVIIPRIGARQRISSRRH
jgi:L-ascorbate metabolism protein UlaG (beta-lactamase superfamily)